MAVLEEPAGSVRDPVMHFPAGNDLLVESKHAGGANRFDAQF